MFPIIHVWLGQPSQAASKQHVVDWQNMLHMRANLVTSTRILRYNILDNPDHKNWTWIPFFSTNVISCEVLPRTNIERCGAVPATQTTSSRGTKITVHRWQRCYTFPQKDISKRLIVFFSSLWFLLPEGICYHFFGKQTFHKMSKSFDRIMPPFKLAPQCSAFWQKGPGLGVVPSSILSALSEPRTPNKKIYTNFRGSKKKLGKKHMMHRIQAKKFSICFQHPGANNFYLPILRLLGNWKKGRGRKKWNVSGFWIFFLRIPLLNLFAQRWCRGYLFWRPNLSERRKLSNVLQWVRSLSNGIRES